MDVYFGFSISGNDSPVSRKEKEFVSLYDQDKTSDFLKLIEKSGQDGIKSKKGRKYQRFLEFNKHTLLYQLML
jgi:hypothetical protein